jgi:hypothetical protein
MNAIAQAQKKVGTSRCDVPRKLSGQRGVPTLTWVHLIILSALACMPTDRVAAAEDRGLNTVATTKIAADTAATTKGKAAFVFGGVGYFHRWSQDDQHEFTPTSQDDLQKWTDMITINVYPSARDGDALAVKANAVLENYKSHGGRVLRTDSVPRTPNRPAEHFIAVVFGRPNFLESAFARFKLVDGVGCSIVYSHRIYGEKVGDQMSKWLNDNGPKMEKLLMDWSNSPSPASLRQLPRTANGGR